MNTEKADKRKLLLRVLLIIAIIAILLLLLLHSCEGAKDFAQGDEVISEPSAIVEVDSSDPLPVADANEDEKEEKAEEIEEAENEPIEKENTGIDTSVQETQNPSQNASQNAQAAGQTAPVQQVPAAPAQPQAPQETPATQPGQEDQMLSPTLPVASSQSHSHTWEAITEQRWIVDKEAYDDEVKVPKEVLDYGLYVCECGAEFESEKGLDEHQISFLDTDYEDAHSSWHSKGVYKTVYETTTVHHDEEGHYETVTTGYQCSTCGATK